MPSISRITTDVKEFPLEEGDGTDSIHTDPVYSYIVTYLHADNGVRGTGIVFTIGAGNQEIRSLVEGLSQTLLGRDIEELMSVFGVCFRKQRAQ